MSDLFGGEPVSLQDMLGCARRELGMRKKVYPRLVHTGKMTADEASGEQRVMEAIVAHFERLMRG